MSLPSLSLGNVTIGFPVVQAALSGYSDWPMRLLARRHGASYTLCEVMLDGKQEIEPRLKPRQLADGTIVSPALEDMFPFLDPEELKANLFIKPLQ